jgi:hypothetical protein
MTEAEELAAMLKQIDQAKMDTAVLEDRLKETITQMREIVKDQDPNELQRELLEQITKDKEKRKKDLNELRNAVLWDLTDEPE